MVAMPPLFEQCVDTLDGAYEAVRRGADRIELCSHLELDGLTPPAEHLTALLRRADVPVFPMVRPRPGDFRCPPAQLEQMRSEIETFKRLGAHGIVTGALTSAGAIDADATAQLVSWAAPLPLTFHRAFDEVPDPHSALEELIDLGVARILSAGQAANAPAGAELLSALVQRAGNRLTVIAGGGVRPQNVAQLIARTGVREVHASVPLRVPGGLPA